MRRERTEKRSARGGGRGHGPRRLGTLGLSCFPGHCNLTRPRNYQGRFLAIKPDGDALRGENLEIIDHKPHRGSFRCIRSRNRSQWHRTARRLSLWLRRGDDHPSARPLVTGVTGTRKGHVIGATLEKKQMLLLAVRESET